ncbi:hypothetical protein GCM10023188_03010 [Pontibacter saemangeumensis]|uniref:CAAX protease n=1 Tax=Pontibacter saemangeumensis TaxID=1084525 RepID=A0ABP8L7V2_9BACT
MDEIEKKKLINLYEQVKSNDTFSYIRALEKFKKDEYYKFYLFLQSNRQVNSFLNYNYSKLVKLVEYHNSPEVHSKVWDDYNPSYRWRQQRSITMQLFNYLSSIFATVDFSRSNMRGYISLNPEVESKLIRSKEIYFDKNPHHKFIQDLRNYTSHNSYLRIGTEFSINGESDIPKRNVYILKSELLESDKWHSLSKKLLESQESKIYIIDIIKNHFPVFNEFQNWCYLALLQVTPKFTLEFRNELEGLLTFAERVDLARTSLPFNQSYIRYIDLIIKESESRCSIPFEYLTPNTNIK